MVCLTPADKKMYVSHVTYINHIEMYVSDVTYINHREMYVSDVTYINHIEMYVSDVTYINSQFAIGEMSKSIGFSTHIAAICSQLIKVSYI